jgi:hypothetical protein
MATKLAKVTHQPVANLIRRVDSGTLVDSSNNRMIGGVAGIQQIGKGSASRTYYLDVDGKTIAGFTVDAITGNPKLVSKAASEGNRLIAWTGSGRVVMG